MDKGNLQTSNFQAPRIIRGNLQYNLIKHFDPDYSPGNPVNREAARQRGLIYDSEKRIYVDED